MHEKKKTKVLFPILISLSIIVILILSVSAPLSSFFNAFNYPGYEKVSAFPPTAPSNTLTVRQLLTRGKIKPLKYSWIQTSGPVIIIKGADTE